MMKIPVSKNISFTVKPLIAYAECDSPRLELNQRASHRPLLIKFLLVLFSLSLDKEYYFQHVKRAMLNRTR